jgi:uncharacterized protein (DUF983 family)
VSSDARRSHRGPYRARGERRLAFFRRTYDGSIVCAACGLHLGAHHDLTRCEALLSFVLLGALAVVTVGWLYASWLLVWSGLLALGLLALGLGLLALGPFVVHVTTARR